MTIWFHIFSYYGLWWTLHDFELLVMILERSSMIFGGLLWVQMDSLISQRGAHPVPPMLHTFLWAKCMMLSTYIYIYLSNFIGLWWSLFGSQMYQRGLPPCTPWASYISGTRSARTLWERRPFPPVADASRPVVSCCATRSCKLK